MEIFAASEKEEGHVTNEQRARDWITNSTGNSYQLIESLTALLTSVQAEGQVQGAKAARYAMTSVPNGYSIFPVNELIERLEAKAAHPSAGES